MEAIFQLSADSFLVFLPGCCFEANVLFPFIRFTIELTSSLFVGFKKNELITEFYS